MKTRKNNSEFGFTLIEVIITIVVVAIVAAMMTAYFGKGLTQSSLSIFNLTATSKLNAVMEKISAQYGQYPSWQKDTTYAAEAIILPTPAKRTGLLYKKIGVGTSGANEPTWPLTIDGATSDGIWTTVWTTLAPTAGAAPTLALTRWQRNTPYRLNDIIVPSTTPATPTNPTSQYICIVSGNSSGVEPVWTTGIINDGAVAKWQQIAPIVISPMPTLILKDVIGPAGSNYEKTFGSDTVPVRYRVIENKFIMFKADKTEDEENICTESACTSVAGLYEYGRYLKVTIGLHSQDADAARAGTLTTLFVAR